MKRIIINLTVLFLAFINITINAQGVRGDVNGDKKVQESDITSIVSYIYGNTDISKGSADVNKDGAVNVADISTVINIIADRKQISQALSSGSVEAVTTLLKEFSGTDRVDGGAVATALQSNPDVEEAVSDDGNNVVVKMRGSESHIIYPLFEVGDIISDYDESIEDIQIASARNMARHQGLYYNGKVAIFNHFSGIPGYKLQNRIVSNIKIMFELNGYDVAYYGTNPSYEYNGNIDYEQYFDHNHLNDVIDHSDEYAAILIFSHGYENYGKSYFATGEKFKTAEGEEWYIFEKENGEYYLNYPVEALKTDNKCILYLGSCFGVPAGGLSDDSFISEKNSCFIGWDGKNRVAQADALMLFNSMLVDGLTLDQAKKCTFDDDTWNPGSHRRMYNTANHSLAGNVDYNYLENKGLSIKTTKSIYRKEDNKTYIELKIKAQGEWNYPAPVRIRLEPMLNRDSNPLYEEFFGFIFSDKEQIAHLVVDNATEEDLFKIYAWTLKDQEWRNVKLSLPQFLMYTFNVSDNSSEPLEPVLQESEMRKPFIFDYYGQPVEKISLVASSTKPFIYNLCDGHYWFKTPSMDENICTASRYGSKLMVTGVSEGTTYFCIYDEVNYQMSLVEVTVKAEDAVPYSSCPDNHHPHMIDVGLPSGILWACCNVGADKPEGYGGYYAWGETEEKNDYSRWTSKYWSSSYHDISGTEDDVANVKWGGSWQMPLKPDFTELDNFTAKKVITKDDVVGMMFIGDNGNSIFLPFSGYYTSSLHALNDIGYYWSGSKDETLQYGGTSGQYWINGNQTDVRFQYRDDGNSVRPVSK